MTIVIAPESPLTDDGRALIEGSEAALREVYTADECFTFSAQELVSPEIEFLVAREDDVALGCVALVDCGEYGEIKRLFVNPDARGRSLGEQLITELERRAHSAGLKCMKLETGEKLAAAVGLYKRLGYSVCGAFGPYEEHPASLFMEKALS